MKSLQASVLMALLVAFGMSCTSTTALQSSETDDMYFASTDKTVRKETGTPPSGTSASDEAVNPEYSGAAGSNSSEGTSITNNYNYYDSNYSYASRSRTVRSPYRNWSYYDYGYYNDPYWYAPGAFVSPYYSAVYCYPGLYDPFWGPAYYPYSGLTVSIGYGFGYGGFYGGYRPWGYQPWGGYYGGGFGNGYYQGFYEGYYAGNNSYYGVNRKVNYGPRGDRSNVPQRAPASATGRPASNGGRQDVSNGIAPGRPATSGNSATTAGRPQRANVNSNQPEPATPANARPARTVGAEQSQVGQVNTPAVQPEQPAGRPSQAVKPQQYEFQERPVQQTAVQQSNPRNNVNQNTNMPAMQDQNIRPEREAVAQPARPVYQAQPGLSRPGRQQVGQAEQPVYQPVPERAPQQQESRGIFGRPSRSEQQSSAPVIRENRGGNSQPSYQPSAPSRSESQPANSGGRPRR